MSGRRPLPQGPGFGHAGGSNLSDYLGSAERSVQIELKMESGERLIEIPVECVDRSPFQARASFDAEEIAALSEDIQENGLNHPITVRQKPDGRYELVAGERRWLAVQSRGLPRITARVRSLDDFAAHLIGISENNQRASLSPWEMALEAFELLEHARTAGRPHGQRDLARYLNRNVAVVNQQLAIAATITEDLLSKANLDTGAVCRLPHVTLHRIAKLPEAGRARALREAIRTQRSGRGDAGTTPKAQSSEGAHAEADEPDQWTHLWERGGFQLQVRKPFRELEPMRAHRYVQQLLPAIGALAARAADEGDQTPVIGWTHERGWVVFVRCPERLTDEERATAHTLLQYLLESVAAAGAATPPG